jgi:hypothetical protein
MAEPQTHAVCITGAERSFGEIGANVREGVLRMLGTPRVAFFGVKPTEEAWDAVQRLLPLTAMMPQRKCWDAEDLNVTIRWVHCDLRGRATDCRVSFIQTMCDLATCEGMVSRFEARQGMQFATVTKLRPDVFWEAAVDLPAVDDNTVFVPRMDAAGGLNDKLAVGGRAAMRAYLSRYKLVKSAPGMADSVGVRLQGGTTEMFLDAALRRERVKVKRVTGWVTCMHNRKMLLSRLGYRGCIGRVRCRTPCESLLVPGPPKASSAPCHNVSCAAMRAGELVGSVPYSEGGSDGKRGDMTFGTWKVDPDLTPAHWQRIGGDPDACVDVGGGRQLFHACPPFAGKQERGPTQCGPACEWPRDAATGAYVRYERLDDLPDCILPALRSDTEPASGRCRFITHKTIFINSTGGVWPWAWPLKLRKKSMATLT